jgi:hypothetical protein
MPIIAQTTMLKATSAGLPRLPADGRERAGLAPVSRGRSRHGRARRAEPPAGAACAARLGWWCRVAMRTASRRPARARMGPIVHRAGCGRVELGGRWAAARMQARAAVRDPEPVALSNGHQTDGAGDGASHTGGAQRTIQGAIGALRRQATDDVAAGAFCWSVSFSPTSDRSMAFTPPAAPGPGGLPATPEPAAAASEPAGSGRPAEVGRRRLSLLWWVLLANASVLLVAFLLLAFSPIEISVPIALGQLALLGAWVSNPI